MTEPGFDVDPVGMAGVAARMSGSTAALGAAAGGGGGTPVAGTATGAVADYLEAVSQAAAAFTAAAQHSADAAGQAATGYARGDGDAASRIGAVPMPGPPGPGRG